MTWALLLASLALCSFGGLATPLRAPGMAHKPSPELRLDARLLFWASVGLLVALILFHPQSDVACVATLGACALSGPLVGLLLAFGTHAVAYLGLCAMALSTLLWIWIGG